MSKLDIDNKSIEELLDEADAKLKEAGIDPNAHPADDEEGADGGLNAGDDSSSDDSGSDTSGDDNSDAGDADDKGGADAAATATATDESGQKVTFANAEELSKFVADQMKTMEDSKKTPEEKQEAKDKLESMTFFEEGYKPKDWNVAMREIIKNIRPVLKQMDQEESKTVKDKIQSINAEMDAAYDEIAKTSKLPVRTSAEGKEIDRQITAVGAAFGVTDYKKAHEMWAKLPKDTELTFPNGTKVKAGGLDYKPTTEKKPNPSKEASRLQSVGKGGGSSKAKKIDYKGIHNQSMDQLLEEDL